MGKVIMPGKYASFATHCLARSNFQLPDIFLPSNVAPGYFKKSIHAGKDDPFDVVIETDKLAKIDFEKNIALRSASLKVSAIPDLDILRMEKKLSQTATLFRIQQVEEAYQNELHFLLNDSKVIVKLDSFHNTYYAAEDRLIKFMSDFIIQGNGSEPGFCLGPLSIRGDFVDESGKSYWRDNAGNTFDIKIDTFGTNASRLLLERMAGPDSLLSLFHIGHTVLRARERTVAGMRAQEWLGWTNLGENRNEKTFKFVLETIRPTGGRATPRIQLTFDSAQKLEDGTETKTNLSDDEAMAIWDKVVDSIQPAK